MISLCSSAIVAMPIYFIEYHMPALYDCVSVVEAADVLGVHWETVKRLCRESRIPAEKVGNKWLIHKDSLREFATNYNEPHRGKRK